MTFYLKIEDQNFEVPSSFIVGSAGAFSSLKDSSISATHLQLTLTKGQWHIKDLNSESGTFINGKKIKSGKYFKINVTDKIQIGKVDLNFVEEEPEGEIIKIDSEYVKDVKESKGFWYISLMLFIPIEIQIAFDLFAKGYHPTLGIIYFSNLVIAFLILFIANKFARFLMSGLYLKEVILSRDGFTFQFWNGKFWILNSSGLESWIAKKDKILINTNGREIAILTEGEFKKLHSHFKTFFGKNEKSKAKENTELFLFSGISIALALYFFQIDITTYVVVPLILLWAIWIIWEFRKPPSRERTQYLKVGFASLLLLTFVAFEMFEKKEAAVNKICSTNSSNCKESRVPASK